MAWPPSESREVPWADGPIGIFTRKVEAVVPVELGPQDVPALGVRLRIQACDDSRCLEPETLVLEIPTAGAR